MIPGGLTWSVGDDLALTCISTGGPATTVTWTRDSTTVTQGTQTVLNDPVAAQYIHTMTVTGALGGVYTCTVANNKPSTTSASLTVQGTVRKRWYWGLYTVSLLPVHKMFGHLTGILCYAATL